MGISSFGALYEVLNCDLKNTPDLCIPVRHINTYVRITVEIGLALHVARSFWQVLSAD